MSHRNAFITTARVQQTLFLLIIATLCGTVCAPPAAAQTYPYLSVVSGNNGDSSGVAHNLTFDNNGTSTYNNTLVGSFSTSYNLTTHVLGTVSTPTTGGYTTTPIVVTDSTLINYTGQVSGTDPGGKSLQSELVSSYNPETSSNNDAVGYYMDKVTFSLSSSAPYQYQIAGLADSDNEVQDVILDYGVNSSGVQTGTVLNLTALNNTEVRTTNNAASNAYFVTNSGVSLSGQHTLSIIYYNNVGPSNISFGFNSQALPEPTAVALLSVFGLPLVVRLVNRRVG